jgi:hypothetical protein
MSLGCLWNLLPDEIKLECFSHLKEVDLCRAACVSSQWRVLSLDPTLWPEYSTSASSWGSVPSPRVCHSAVTYNKKMFVYGGHNPAPGILIDFVPTIVLHQKKIYLPSFGDFATDKARHTLCC